jgi:hypothetical protein
MKIIASFILHFTQLAVSLNKIRCASEMKIIASFILHFTQLAVSLQLK